MPKKTKKKTARRTTRPRSRSRSGVSASGSGAAAPRAKGREKNVWTIMLYLAGDNNLSDEMVWALKEVYRTGTPKGVTVTLQFDPLAEGRSTRFAIAPKSDQVIDLDGVFPLLHDDDLPELDCGNPDVLVDFVCTSMKRAPADYYMLILSGHGSGVVGDFLTDGDAKRALQPGSLSIPDLQQVFPTLRSKLGPDFFQKRRTSPIIDVLGMDSCLMSMAEICSEIRNETQFLVGSEGFDPLTGWPYFRLLEGLKQLVDAGHMPEPMVLVTGLVDRYTTYYSDFIDADVSVDIAACELVEDPNGAKKDKVATLEEAVKEFVKYYRGHRPGPSRVWLNNLVVLAHWRAQSYKWEQYVDLWDFFDLLEKECVASNGPKELVDRCGAVKDAVTGLVSHNDYSGIDFQHSHGLSVYLPWSRDSFAKDYRSTAFAMRTGWDRFVDGVLDGTRRRVQARPLGNPDTARDPDTGGTIALEVRTVEPEKEEEVRIVFSGLRSAFSPLGQATLGSFGRTTPPAGRTTPPAGRTTPPAGRTTPPAGRTTPPAGRVAQYINQVLKNAPSTMKNPARECDRVMRFRVKDWDKIGRLGKADELIEKLALLAISRANRRLLGQTEPGRKLLKRIDETKKRLEA